MRRQKRATLQDVAREAGVTAMTVSVVLNGARSATRVSEATRARIHEAAERLNYRPNAVARGLSRRRMDTVGVVAIIDGGEVNLYFLELLNGILEAAAENGQNTTVFSIQTWNEEERILAYCDGRVDGLVLIAPDISPTFAERLRRARPFVTLHSNQALPDTYDVSVDDLGGAYAVVRHLIEFGHRRILHLTGGALSGAQRRLDGYRKALEAAGLPYDESLVLPAGYSIDAGRRCAAAMLDLQLLDPLPTAIFCASDAIASGCMEVLASRGIRVPDDISIAGFDDTLAAKMTSPPLTTARQPFRRMGKRAVEWLMPLIDQLEGTSEAGLPGPYTEVFSAGLIVRASTGPAPTTPDR